MIEIQRWKPEHFCLLVLAITEKVQRNRNQIAHWKQWRAAQWNENVLLNKSGKCSDFFSSSATFLWCLGFYPSPPWSGGGGGSKVAVEIETKTITQLKAPLSHNAGAVEASKIFSRRRKYFAIGQLRLQWLLRVFYWYYKTCCQPPWLELHLQVEASEQLTKVNLWRKLRNASFFVPGMPRRLLRESSIAWYQCFRRKTSVLHCPYFQGFIFIPLCIQLTYLLWHSFIGTNFKGVYKK